MLTKTLRFDEDVLQVLRGQTTWSEDGLQARIQPLERKLYEKTAKALKAMGGQWVGGKTQATVFTTDPRPQVEGLLETGTLEVAREGFFETPEEVVHAMLARVPLSDTPLRILEPEAGKGAILRVLLKQPTASRHFFYAVEANGTRAHELSHAFVHQANVATAWGDILTHQPMHSLARRFDRAYMNPPFELSQDTEHVKHVFGLLAPGGRLISVMANNGFRGDAKMTDFQVWLHMHGGQEEKLPPGAFKASGTMVNTRLVWLTKPA